MSQRVLSGTRPTSKLHLGNLLGAIENWKKYQSQDAFYMIADWHALTTEYASHLPVKEHVMDVALDYLSCGLNPDICTLFVQSHVHEHAELYLILSMISPLGWLERNPTYKDQLASQEGKDLYTHGFLGYPVLQAADILLYQADLVPVGEDQLPHIELTRELARRFNFLYGNIFKEPQAALTRAKKLPGLDGRKMSKTYQNCIYISETTADVESKMRTMMTDPGRKRREDKGNPDICPVYFFHELFTKDRAATIHAECREAKIGCVDCKKECARSVNTFLEPMREVRASYASRLDTVRDILATGAQKAQRIAAETLGTAKKALGII